MNDYIVEGFHIEPELINNIQNQYHENIKAIIVVKKDVQSLLNGITESSTKNDWILEKTKDQDTFIKIAMMISEYSIQLENEANKFGIMISYMDSNFETRLKDAASYLLV